MSIRKILYLFFLGIALFVSALYVWSLPLPGPAVLQLTTPAKVSFVVRSDLDIVWWGILLWLFFASWRNFLVSFDAKHTTTISKK